MSYFQKILKTSKDELEINESVVNALKQMKNVHKSNGDFDKCIDCDKKLLMLFLFTLDI